MSALAAAAVFCSIVVGGRKPGLDLGGRLADARPRRGWPWSRIGPVGAFLALLGASVWFGGAAGGSVTLALAGPAGTAGWLVTAQRGRRAALATRRDVVRACQSLAGLVRIGHVPTSALAAAAAEHAVLAESDAVRRVGGAVAPVLRRQARRPGHEGLHELANAWEVSERTGASLTATLDALSERLVEQARLRHTVRAELSAPRATGRLLGVLPVAGIMLGYSFGGDPVGYLTGSPAGLASLVAGSLLGCAGIVWTERIADRQGG